MTVEEGMIVRFNQNEHEIIETAAQAVLMARAEHYQQQNNVKLITETIAKLRGIDVNNGEYILKLDKETKMYILEKVADEAVE